MIKNIIFDFDGVIADSFDLNWSLSKEQDETATMEDFLAHHDGNVFETPRIKFKPELQDFFYSEYRRRLTPSHTLLASEPLKRLAKNRSLFVISSNSEEAIKENLRDSGIFSLFKVIMGVETHKSKVEKFNMLIADYGITPDNTIFITDTLGDINEAHKVNIRTIAETFGFHDKERLMQGNPFRIADSWEEIEAIIAELER